MIKNFAAPLRKILRKDDGVDGDAQRISQIVWLLFLKILDGLEVEKELMDESYKSPIKTKYRWKTWAQPEDGLTGDDLLEFINEDLFPYLKDLHGRDDLTKIIKEIFGDAINFMKSGVLLRQVINLLNTIDFQKRNDRDTLGDFYEQMLKELQSAGKAGEFYTPRAVTKFMTETINPEVNDKIIDPACGTGGFITSYIQHLRVNKINSVNDEEQMHKNFEGIDKKNLPFTLCVTNLLLNKIPIPSQIVKQNLLKKPYIDYTSKDEVDIVLSNPPFGGQEEDGIELNFPKEFQTRETADLFLFVTMRILKKNKSKCAIILPDNFLFTTDGVKRRLKEKLLEEFNLHTIIKLHHSTFKPYAEVKTNILFFDKSGSTEDIWYFEHPLPEGQKAYSKTRTIQYEEFDLEKKWWNNRIENKYCWKVNIKEIIENDFDMDFKNPSLIKIDKDEDHIKIIENLEKDIGSISNSIELIKKNFS